MPLPFNKTLDVKLLNLVKENPILYNVKHPKYMDFDSREVIWQKIGDELERPACEFAGIQCQILYGDYQEDKHKHGYIEYKELLPTHLSSKGGLEKKILKEYKQHQGLSSIDAKYLYTKTARDLPTYGVTFFVVKEQQAKGKKKLVPRLLGISASAVLRLDEESKEVLQAWPLTQVKSYQLGKSHTFTLNFGDYSDKEYSVKTNDAVRIRDILQGYIDIIAKRMAGAASGGMGDGASVMEDTVMVSKGTFMQHVQNNPSKVVQETFVGPTKILAYEPGQTASQGTQLVTANTLIISHQGNQQQYQTSGQVPLRKEMSLDFVKKLNRMNSNSVKVVNLITSADGPHTAQLKDIVDTMEHDMPLIEAGVTEILRKDMDPSAKKRLQDELQELAEQLTTLSTHVRGSDPGSDASLEAASKIADLSTQMYLGLDPLTKRRSQLVRMSRTSFLADEKVQATLNRASFTNAASTAGGSVDNASLIINQAYNGPELSPSQVDQQELEARDNMRRLNGAVALFLAAHADPENVDYLAAVSSMNTINELIVELAKDAQALASTKDGAAKQELIDDVNKLCDATRLVCSLTASADGQKLQDVTSVYGPVADKLIFTFGRGRRDDKDNKIIELAKAVGEKTSLLLVKANEVCGLEPQSAAAQELDNAGLHCAATARDLLACAMLTSPCIHEPHCQSALTASAETLSTAAQKLLIAAKPLLEEQCMRQRGEDLKERSLELARALDALKNAYGNESQMGDIDGSARQERQRLKFVMSLNDAKRGLDDAERELDKPSPPSKQTPSPVVVAMLEKNLAQRVAEYSSAVAELLVAISDRDNPNYHAAEAALSKINELLPVIVKDTKTLASSKDEATRQSMLSDLGQLCGAARGVCGGAGRGGDLHQSAAALANVSNKLYFTFNPSAPADKEQEILDITTAACTKASQMLANVYQLAEETGGSVGQDLDTLGARTADGAKALLTCAQLTASCIDNPSCQSSLIQAADLLSASSSAVVDSCVNVQSPLVDKLRTEQRELETELGRLRRACGSSKGPAEGNSKSLDTQRLKFVKSMSATKSGLAQIQGAVSKPYEGIPPKRESSSRQQRLNAALAKLNAAMATLAAATSDLENPNYDAANEALAAINENMPEVVKETKAMSSLMAEADRRAVLEDLQRLCGASRGICDTVHQDPQKLQQFAKEFGAASGKLVFTFNPHAKPAAANQVMKQAYEACTTADRLVGDSIRLSEQLPSDVTADLRHQAANTKTAADSLMMFAQLTAASMDHPHCQSALISSVDALSSSAQHLAQQWAPHTHADELLAKKLDAGHKNLLKQLEEMMRDFQKSTPSVRQEGSASRHGLSREQWVARFNDALAAGDFGPGVAVRSAKEDVQREQFATSAAAAMGALLDVENELNKPYTGKVPKGEGALIRQHQLNKSLSKLNAALASLATATADPDNPDYEAASQAMAVINETLPLVARETKVLASVKGEQERQAMLCELAKLCEATRGVCNTAQLEPYKLREFAKECGVASGKLVFVLNPHAKPAAVNQVMKKANEACQSADRLVNAAHALADLLPAVGFMEEAETIRNGAERTVHATDNFATVAQLTSSSIDDPHCQSALLSSLETLSSSAQQLAQLYAPLHGKVDDEVMRKLDAEQSNLKKHLENMKKEYSRKPSRVGRSSEEERQRQQFVKSAAAAGRGLVEVEKELNKPYSGDLPKAEQAICQHQLGDAMARLNAAIAALTAATQDPDNPDYPAADEAMATISEIMPLIVKDMKAMSSSAPASSRAAMLSELSALCNAARDVCDGHDDPQQLRESARKFGAASGKLLFVLSPRAKPDDRDKVVKQVDLACHIAHQLVKDTNTLADQLASDPVSDKLRHAGNKTMDSADALATTAQLTAPTVEYVRCQAALLSSVDGLSLTAHELAQQWAAVQDQNMRGVVVKLGRDHGALQMQLEAVRRECQGDESDSRPASGDKKRVFAGSVAAAKSELKNIEQELNKPLPAPPAESASLRARTLSRGLARLNAALAALAAATTNPDVIDYTAADEAMNTIHETLPLVVKETRAVAATQDEIAREVMLDNARELCLTTQGICDSAEKNPTALRDFAQKFAAASGRLVYVVNAEAKPATANQVIEATQAACNTAASLAKLSSRLADQLSPEITADHIRQIGYGIEQDSGALMTVAQLTAPCISDPHCQSSLSAAIDHVSASADDLTTSWSPLAQEPLLVPIVRQLVKEHQKLTSDLEALRSFCKDSKKGLTANAEEDELRKVEAEKNQFIAKAAAAKEAMAVAEKELDKVAVGPPAKGEAAALQMQQLSQRLAKLHAALLALSVATSDNKNPDYVSAEQAMDSIRELMPHVVKNANSLLCSKGEASPLVSAELRALCRAAGDACDCARAREDAKLNEQLTKNVMPKLGKLFNVVHPNVGTKKLAKVESCAKASCVQASQLLSSVSQLSEATDPATALLLDREGARAADAAKALLTTVQYTGPYIHEPQSQSTLIALADALSTSAQDIAAVWKPLLEDPKHRTVGEKLQRDLQELETELEKFKSACKEPEPEAIVHKPSIKAKPPPPPRKPVEEDLKKKQFSSAMENEMKGLIAAEGDIKRIYNTKLDAPQMHKDQVRGVQKALESKIALTNVATSALLACNASEPMDYASAAKHSTELANLLPKIAQDAKLLSNTMSEAEKKAFLDDILAMFDATKKVIESAQTDRQSFNGAAVEFGNKSGALLYSISTDIDPSHEKEVISRAKQIGDCVSEITLGSAQVMSGSNPEAAARLCSAGKHCAAAAGNLVYTAKLVAPSIQVSECQEILQSTVQSLSSSLRAFSSGWRGLAEAGREGMVEELDMKAAKVDGLLEELRKDLSSGKLIKMRPLKPLVIEDTPLRKLTAALIENAMKKSSAPSTSAEQKRALVEYARALTDASETLDRANAVCKKEPHDLEKSRELEQAVQNLQVLALQSRPSAAQQQQYIVDLTEFVKEVSQEADQMVSTVTSCSVKHKEIDSTCQQIAEEAQRIVHPSNEMNRGDGTTVDDIYDVDRFGRTTDRRVKNITSQIKVLPDCKDKDILSTQSVSLEDSCNILRFATQSAIATTQSASFDEALSDLSELETRIDRLLHAGDKPGRHLDEPVPWAARAGLLQAVRSASAPQLCAALTRYTLALRARSDGSDEGSQRLKQHVSKLCYLLRVLLVQSNRRVATWQELDGPEVAAVTEQVLKEIDAGCSHNQPKKSSVLQHIDVNRLLLSSDVVKIEGDRKHVEEKLQQTASKLTSSLPAVLASSAKPDSLARSLAATADAAMELAAIARALKKTDDPLFNARIEEATGEATFQTYNVLKASELVSQEPNNLAYRRRLLEACHSLNDALNNLSAAARPARPALQRSCSALCRELQLQQTALSSLHGPQPASALPYKECLDALTSQQEVIQKLNSDEPMSRAEFLRTLRYVATAVNNSTELAAQCGYLMSLSERDVEATRLGVVDVQQLGRVAQAAQDTCYTLLQLEPQQAKEEAVLLTKQTQEIREALADAEKKSQHLKEEIHSAAESIDQCTRQLNSVLEGPADRTKISAATTRLLDSIKSVASLTEHPSLVPAAVNVSAEAQQRADNVLSAARDLTNKTAALVRDVKTRHHGDGDDDDEPMTWVTFNLKRKDVVKAFEALLASVKENGQKAGILEVEQHEVEEEAPKSYVQLQVDLANKWLKRQNCKPEVKASGEDATRKVVDIAEKMVVDMKDAEKEDMSVLISETKELLGECSKKCTPDKASQLVERLKGLKKAIERGVITMVVEDLLEGEEPLQDLELLVDSETDESKRKFVLERKLAELLSQLARVGRAARAVASTSGQMTTVEINRCTEQANLLAPLLVKAAQERISTPGDKAAIENYKSLLAQYAESLSKVRELCDRSVDPMEFVQTAGETMQRMREESSHDNDPQKCVFTSTAITKLANRVIQVSMSSPGAKQDPELRKALTEAQLRLQAAVPGPQTRKSNMPDWKDTTAEILRTTGEVEAVMGGENIFQNQPQSDQPIFAAARSLHSAVRGWSARDNDIVAVAKRTAVLMAKLSAHMTSNAQHELIVTSKSIVSNSHEVAELARKLAHECTDMRIKNNLLQVCDRIPTISGQLKMLTTVKGSTLSRQGNKEDQESLNMLVDNAQNLMLSIQEVVKAAAGASVKIASQRGGVRVRWVQKTYY